MKRVGKFAVCLAGGLVLTAGARADNIVMPGDPYAIVVARNIFGLNPPPPVDPNPPDINPPPKITPNGIMTIFGHVQVLFKVANPARTGKAAGDDDYILSEGQRQDGIEVDEIDEKNSIVTFNNHGEIQKLPLVAAAASSTPASVPTYSNANRPEERPSVPNNPNRQITANAASQIPEGMTPEVQTIAIEANRELTRKEVDNGDLPPLPVTEMTPAGTPEAGGNDQPNPNAPQ